MVLAGCGAGPMAAVPPGVPAGQTGTTGQTAATSDGQAAGMVVPDAHGLPGCTLPAPLPTGTDAQFALGGPAVQALRGGAALSGFSLDGGGLTVAPPRVGDRPVVPAGVAECAALASLNGNGWSMLKSAQQGGVAVGYGRVSVSPQVLAASKPPLYLSSMAGGGQAPKLPAASPYRDRLAWIVAVRYLQVASCPAFRGGPGPAKVAPVPTDYGYDLFLMDARTGADALLYAEGGPPPCGFGARIAPSVSVPAEQVSVPWTLVSRDPNGYSGRISATVLPCDGYPDTVLVDRDRPVAGVVVFRPVDAACGQPRQVTLALHAATVMSELPAQIGHEPVGLDIPLPATQAAPASQPTTPGKLVNLFGQDNGKTIHIAVGDVLAVTPLSGVDHTAPSPVASSDPAVLGPLDGPNRGPVAEFRGWKAGRADLSVPQSACHSPDHAAVPCSGAWVVHVVVG